MFYHTRQKIDRPARLSRVSRIVGGRFFAVPIDNSTYYKRMFNANVRLRDPSGIVAQPHHPRTHFAHTAGFILNKSQHFLNLVRYTNSYIFGEATADQFSIDIFARVCYPAGKLK